MKINIKTLYVLILLLSQMNLHASGQRPEILIYKGKEQQLFTTPLGIYFHKNKIKKPKEGISSANWRGYQGTFEIKNNTLFLNDIRVDYWVTQKVEPELTDDPFSSSDKDEARTENVTKSKSIMSDYFNEKQVKAQWYSGILVVPMGKEIKYIHAGFDSIYESYKLIEVKHGEVLGEISFKTKEFMKLQHNDPSEFEELEKYKKLLSRLKAKKKPRKTLVIFSGITLELCISLKNRDLLSS